MSVLAVELLGYEISLGWENVPLPFVLHAGLLKYGIMTSIGTTTNEFQRIYAFSPE